MAKSLEEHLYRSARTKEEYMDSSTLKERLQAIAHGLELHRTSSSSNMSSSGNQHASQTNMMSSQASYSNMQQPQAQSNVSTSQQQNARWNPNSTMQQIPEMQQPGMMMTSSDSRSNMMNMSGQMGDHSSYSNQRGSQMSQQMNSSFSGGMQQGSNWSHGNQMQGNTASLNELLRQSSAAGQGMQQQSQQQQMYGHGNDMDSNMMTSLGQLPEPEAWNPADSMPPPVNAGRGDSSTSDFQNNPKFQEPGAAQRKKVILQQQQRLLLLRHASKCKAGPSCTTKFCGQMVTLWKHMKTCRDKNCKTSHCVSSRCVLNHYRICKSEGKTSTCEVCGPVMAKIKQQESDMNNASDPLAPKDMLHPGSSHHHASQQMTPQAMQMQNQMSQQHLMTGGQFHGQSPTMQGQQMSMQSYASHASNSSSMMPNSMMETHRDQGGDLGHAEQRPQVEMLQEQRMKLQAQLDSLRELQKQQEELMRQQARLQEQAQLIQDPDTQHAQQLREQQLLLNQLQKRCQEQQLLIKSEIQTQSNNSSMSTGQQGQMPSMMQMQTMHQAGGQMMQTAPQVQQQPVEKVKKRASATSGKGKRAASKVRRGSKTKLSEDKPPEPEPAEHDDRMSKKMRPVDAVDESRGQVMLPSKVASVDLSSAASLISSMSKESIMLHMQSLNKKIQLSSRTVTHKCMPLLQALNDDTYGWVFQDAVDPVALGLPDYFEVVKTPMHLELVKKKLENAIYSDMDSFARDVRLVFENAILYNGESSEVGGLAKNMLDKFNSSFTVVIKDIESSQMHLEKSGEACSLCGLQKRRFEPSVLYCQGKCNMQRINRHAKYFTDRSKANHWCESCYNSLNPDAPVVLDDGSEIRKDDLQGFSNDALPEEAWVNCDHCQSWVHQICALFNGRTNKSNATYTCPRCYLSALDQSPSSVRASMKGAADLPHCKMSRELEEGLQRALGAAYVVKSNELGVGVDDIEKADGLSVRVISNIDKHHFVGDEMLRHYKEKNLPTKYPVRSKCIALFQKIHGVDTLLFSMYVYEYGHDCPAPNRRRVYISYLDSVQYFEPRCYRTLAYHTILVEYLRYVKNRGFHTAHIWSCPPTPGDDYVFYCHPPHQLVPREDMLRAWYYQMLDRAKAQGIVIRATTLYDEYFTEEGLEAVESDGRDAACLPYFEGDYIPGEIENIVRNRKTLPSSADASTDGKDMVMQCLGHNLKKMRENFIVVHLRSRRFAMAVERGDDVSDWVEDSDEELVRSKRAKIAGKDSSMLLPTEVSAAFIDKEEDKALVESAASDAVGVATGDTSVEPDGFAHGQGKQPLADLKSGILDSAAEVQEGTNVPAQGDDAPTISASSINDPSNTNASGTENADGPAAVNSDDVENATGSAEVEKAVAGEAGLATEGTGDVPQTAKSESASDAPEGEKEEGSSPSETPDAEHTASSHSPEAPIASIENAEALAVAKTDQPDTEAAMETEVATSEGPGVKVESLVDEPSAEEQQAEDGTQCMPSETADASVEVANQDVAAVDSTTDEPPVKEESVEAPPSASEVNEKAVEDMKPAVEKHMAGLKRTATTVGNTSDEDSPFESEMFESRQQFLNYCQTNHCQFDELRRSKHSTMMVLFQLHNPAAPKFLQQCGACYRDITHGIRYHCNNCSNFDLCEDCYQPVTSGLWAKRDPRFAHDERHTFEPVNMEEPGDTTKSTDREKSLKAHVELLEHAAACGGAPECPLQNCQRMKEKFEHVRSCDVRPKKDCKVCSRVLSLCAMHARLCGEEGACQVPFCDRIRDRYRRLRTQQQRMDDRRRVAQNELYHAAS